ncbi:MAG: PKD domain protein [Candidatus Methanofastidiosum methylothiophilum]|uniref:PKD domain protein n=1 Tax=Candidatus Methanofastidiosum methylothiophilum TaxID=1705564 RepID=A0A150INT7_9EURY|nr:MAG: PKD domain protein [Candidatus Methanofastidiosum methylthiophilus]
MWDYQTDSKVNIIKIVENYIAVGSQKTVYLFKTNGDLIWTYPVSGVPGTVALSRTGPYVSVGTSAGNIYLIDGAGNLKWSYKNKSSVNTIAMTGLGTYIVAGGTDGTILYFNREGTKLWSYTTGGAVNQIDIASQGQYVAAGADKDGYYLFDWNGKKLWSRSNKEIYFWAIHVADDGKWLLGGAGKFMGSSTEMRISNNVCFYNTVNYAKAGEQPDKNTQTTTPIPTETTTTTQTTNKFPTANAGADFETKVGDAVHFDGTKSTDEDGNIVSYKWDFGDGKTSIDGEPLHQYTTAGVYKVTLTVTDDKGDTGQDVMYVTVKETQSPVKGVPGFELPALLGGSAIAYYLISKRKKK